MVKQIAVWRLSAGPNSSFQPVTLDPAPSSLDDASRRLPGGGYTTFRTFGSGRVMHLEDHFNRLEETARLADARLVGAQQAGARINGMPLMIDRARARRALGEALASFPFPDARVRMTLDLEQEPGTLYLLLEPLKTPAPEDYRRGVRAITRTMQRENPKAKLTNFIYTASNVRETLPPGINEVVMIGTDGRALEGLSSNFFAVKDGLVWTAEAGVLSGITRAMVLDAIRDLGIPLRLEGISADDLPEIDEAFITSASRAVLPVTEIDGRAVGDGKPGPVTLQLEAAYRRKVEGALEVVSDQGSEMGDQ